MAIKYPEAVWKPLGPETEPKIPMRILVFHTMVGYLKSTDDMFRVNGYDGVESSFGVGGPWDGVSLDGVIWQWQFADYQADAQGAGNAYCDSVETSDGGNPNNPWSTKQLAALVKLIVWWCQVTGNPCKLVKSTSDRGIGYHRQFDAWNKNHHSCPGDVRLAQLINYVIPTAANILEGNEMALTTSEINDIADRAAYKVWAYSVGAAFVEPDGERTTQIVAGQRNYRGIQKLMDDVAELKTAVAALQTPIVDVQTLADLLIPHLPAQVDPVALAADLLAALGLQKMQS